METAIQTLATKDDITDLRQEIGGIKTNMIRWIFIFWLVQVASTFLLFYLFLKK
jgi:hypothetical protein